MVEIGVIGTTGRVLRVWLGCVEGEGCVDQVGVYDEPRESLAVRCYLGTWLWNTCGG